MFLKNNLILILLIINFIFIISCFSQEIPNCPNNSICFFREQNYTGETFIWKSSHTYRDLPRQLHNHVGSYISNNVNACFKNWLPLKLHNVTAGDQISDFFESDFKGFGTIIDGVSFGICQE